jgi:Tol biopolymer transport system component
MTGDWELFRLGDLPDGVQGDPNLSRGIGERIVDIMPSTSPDKQWVVFTSNRDSNWELYISAVEGDSVRRVTYNTTAIDLDPAWSPLGDSIVYESSRDGNWELYRFNLETGEETRLTESDSNDINATWSFDGTKIAFQSDRDGFWQIYELDLTTMETRLVSDTLGDDHEPQYTRDDQKIVFRSYRDGDNSVLYEMDAAGGNVTRISDPAGNSMNVSVSPDNTLVAYQSNLDGDTDIYIYEFATGETRLLTDNDIEDYAPTWWCDAPVVVFTSDVTDDPNIFDAPALPIDGEPILVEEQATQLTHDAQLDQYPEGSPPEENASRENSFPSEIKNK